MNNQVSLQKSWQMTLEQLVTGTQGRLLQAGRAVYCGVGTDTREDLAGKIFVALKGDSFDAHDFVAKAVEKGAAAVVVHRDVKVETGVAVVRVDDTLLALQRLGSFWRLQSSARIFALTGTNGKTTTKEYAAQILSRHFKTHFNRGSFNNHWGVPMTLLGILPEHELAVVEMGMNHLHEIETLVGIAAPDAVLVTMVGRGHLEGLGSVENVALAKSEIYRFAPAKATRIYNVDNEHTFKMFLAHAQSYPQARLRSFGRSRNEVVPDVDLSVEKLFKDRLVVRGRILDKSRAIDVPIFGVQNIVNLMAAACLALEAGMSADEVWQALPHCAPAWGRSQWIALENGAHVLFDAYNANPESMAGALENMGLLQVAGRKIAVLGEMRELGSFSAELHFELGALVGAKGFDRVFFFGEHRDDFARGLGQGSAGLVGTLDSASGPGAASSVVRADSSRSMGPANFFSADRFDPKNYPAELLDIRSGDHILLKASRGPALEKVMELWASKFGAPAFKPK